MKDLTPAVIMIAMVIVIFMIKLGASKTVICVTAVLLVVAMAIFGVFFGVLDEAKSGLVVLAGIAATIVVNVGFRHLKLKKLRQQNSAGL
jgi:hypothetical protein